MRTRTLLHAMNLSLLVFSLCVQANGIISGQPTDKNDENTRDFQQRLESSVTTASGSNLEKKQVLRRLQTQHMVGGYFQSDPRDPFVIQAAQFAVESLAESKKYSFPITEEEPYNFEVIEALQQVVAGTNYKLTLGISSGDSTTCLGAFKVTIWNHFGELSVTKWGEELSCEEAASLKSN